MTLISDLLKAIRIEIFHRKRCENCSNWLTCTRWRKSECPESYHGAVGPFGKCDEWEKIRW